jgi:DNA-binding transcriptional regulator PaaX
MKSTTQQLLLWLHPKHTERWVSRSQLRELLSELSPGGFRSLLYLQEQAGYLIQHEADGEQYYASTEQGRREIVDLYPALAEHRQDWDGQWLQVVFRDAPDNDANFRYLRSSLLEIGAQALSRGVYLYPAPLPDEMAVTLRRLYQDAVVVQSLQGFELGDERALIDELFTLSDIHKVYSGISKESRSLLKQKHKRKTLTDSQKKRLFSAFARFHTVLPYDLNLLSEYFPRVEGAAELLERLQRVLDSRE